MDEFESLYQEFMENTSLGGKASKNEQLKYFKKANLYECLLVEYLALNDCAESFHKIAIKDLKSQLDMPPWLRLLGYKMATMQYPDTLAYLEGLIITLQLYYSEYSEYISSLEEKAKSLNLNS